MEFKRIEPGDVDAAVEFAITGIRPELYPMRLDRAKVRAGIEHFMRSTSDFHLAAFDAGRIVGGIAAAVYESPMFERCEATVVLFRATVPGVGGRMLSALREWIDNDIRIRRAHIPQEFDASPAMSRLLRRYGFARTQVVSAYEKD